MNNPESSIPGSKNPVGAVRQREKPNSRKILFVHSCDKN
jgi:hypothetical protein